MNTKSRQTTRKAAAPKRQRVLTWDQIKARAESRTGKRAAEMAGRHDPDVQYGRALANI